MSGPNAGRQGGRWRALVLQVKGRTGVAALCCRCGGTIDQSLAWPDPRSFSVDHFPFTRAMRPDLAEDPTNTRPAHLVCNESAGRKAPVLPLGQTSQQW